MDWLRFPLHARVGAISAILTRQGFAKAREGESGHMIVVEKFLAVQHRLDPVHAYCGLLDRGLRKRFSVALCKSYETLICIWIGFIFKAVMFCFWVIGGDYGLLKARNSASAAGGLKGIRCRAACIA